MKDAVALVTGGAGHIGKETCKKLAAEGCQIIVCDKNESAAKEALSEIQSEFKVKGSVAIIDLMDSAAFSKCHDLVKNEYGRLDHLVNCAAFYDDTPGWGVPFEEESYEAWEKVLKVNMLAPFFMVQKLSPLLKKSEVASVVNVSSIYGLVGPDHALYEGTQMTNPAVYGASKGGLQQTTTWLSTVLAPDIRVNTVTPGGLYRGQDEGFVERYKKKTPLKRMATESDVADAIVYMLSEKSKYVTGHNLVVDGGWTAW